MLGIEKSAEICENLESQKEEKMDSEMKKSALRMIPYGLYVLTAQSGADKVAGAGISWVTQASFEPPLLVVAVRVESSIHSVIKESGAFALNVLGKDQKSIAFTFFKTVEREGQKLGGETFRQGLTGAPILESTPAFLECRLVDSLEGGDHSVFVGEVVNAGVTTKPEGRPDEVTLWLQDLGDKVFYGG
jgi:flavin reductase (DIM6/NTAB) family NADH-FMN oxidoreductase RutF